MFIGFSMSLFSVSFNIFPSNMQGDHITYLNVYKGFLHYGKSSQWCHKNFINYHAMVSFFCLLVAQCYKIIGFSIFNFLVSLPICKCGPFCVVLLTSGDYLYLLPGCIVIANVRNAVLVQKKVVEIREQLSKLVQRLGIGLKSCDGDTKVIYIYKWAHL